MCVTSLSTPHLSTSSHRPLNSIVALLDHASMRTARYVLVVMIVVHVVTTAAAPGSAVVPGDQQLHDARTLLERRNRCSCSAPPRAKRSAVV